MIYVAQLVWLFRFVSFLSLGNSPHCQEFYCYDCAKVKHRANCREAHIRINFDQEPTPGTRERGFGEDDYGSEDDQDEDEVISKENIAPTGLNLPPPPPPSASSLRGWELRVSQSLWN